MKNSGELIAITTVDGRYWDKTKELSNHFSEYALIRTRVEIEIEYLIFLSENDVSPKINKKRALREIYKNFSIKDSQRVKDIEKETNHDVKAVEYFIAEKLKKLKLEKLKPFVHFALTSADVNNIAYRLMIKRSLNDVLLPELNSFLKKLTSLSRKHANTPMLARTHGQPAVPTTFGKEVAVFEKRLEKQIDFVKEKKLEGKLGGAIGNWNAHKISFPEKDWIKLSEKFLNKFGLSHSKISTQIAPPEDILDIFQHFILINSIIYDLDQDIWRYISDGWVIKKAGTKEVGSSAMPQKVNPINFENSEGNIEIANGIFETLIRVLPVSRLQRDLSDSTVMRNIGAAFAHSLIAYKSAQKGLDCIRVNKEKMKLDLNQNWNILSEALQIILRKEGKLDAYEKVASLTKNQIITRKKWIKMVESLALSDSEKGKLLKLTPENYLGYAEKIADYEKK